MLRAWLANRSPEVTGCAGAIAHDYMAGHPVARTSFFGPKASTSPRGQMLAKPENSAQ